MCLYVCVGGCLSVALSEIPMEPSLGRQNLADVIHDDTEAPTHLLKKTCRALQWPDLFLKLKTTDRNRRSEIITPVPFFSSVSPQHEISALSPHSPEVTG